MTKYKESSFVQSGFEGDAGEWSESDSSDIALIKNAHPELKTWGDLAVGIAWGDYSQDELDVNWCDWLVGQRDIEFLNYIADKS
jgi:hypothetical protein